MSEASISPHAYFNRVLSHTSEPLIGLEYVILFPYPKLTIKPFHCALCDKAFDETLIASHLVSSYHRVNYLNLNFPSLVQHLRTKRRYVCDMNQREVILTQVARNLQSLLTQISSPVVDFDEFKEGRARIIQELTATPSFDERGVDKFVELLRGVERLDEDLDDSSSESCCGDKIEIYNTHVDSMERHIDDTYTTYRQQPDLHPEFIDSWETFHSYREQIVRNFSAVSDLTPHWQKYWLVRMEELKQQTIFEKKQEIRKRIGLSASDLFDYHDDLQAKLFKPHELENHQFKSNGDSDSDYGKEYVDSCIRGPGIPPRKRKRRCLVTELHRKSDDELLDPENFKYDSPGTVFSIVRHLMAMQPELGYIVGGIKRFYLKSAQMEKEKAFSSEILLQDEDNFMTFTVIAMKVRSAIDRRDFAEWKLRGVRRVLQQLNAMLNQASYRNKHLEDTYRRCLERITIPCAPRVDGSEESQEIARIVTQFLGKQGEDLESGDLDVIVEAIKKEMEA